MDCLNAMPRQIVYKQYAAVFVSTAITHALKTKRCLYWCIAHGTWSTRKLVAIEVETSDKEESLVETCNGEARKGLYHVGMEIPAILLLEAGGTRG